MEILKKYGRKFIFDPCFRKYIDSFLNEKMIHAGIFKGMRYINQATGSVLFPKMIGTYESEISVAIKNAVSRIECDGLIDVGAAEGYYSVGIAWRFRKHVIAFEMENTQLIRELIRMNGVENLVEVEGFCDLSSLENALDSFNRPFLIMDAEGNEALLLDPAYVPKLKSVEILVEIHDAIIPGCGQIIGKRLEESHDIERIYARPRCHEDFPRPVPSFYGIDSSGYALAHLSEGRSSKTYWIHAVPRVIR